MIRIDAIWLATEPMDMRSGTEKALAQVVAALCLSLCQPSRQSHEGIGARRTGRLVGRTPLAPGKFSWPSDRHGDQVELNTKQLQALVVGLPWQWLGSDGAIRNH